MRTGRRIAMTGGLALALGACASTGGGDGGGTSDNGGSWLGGLNGNWAVNSIEYAVGSGMLPSILATIEETCVASEVLAENAGGFGSALAIGLAANIIQDVIEKETGRKPMFCDQNFVGMLLTTDRLMVRSIREVALGMEIANRALGNKAFDVPRTLQLFLASDRTSMTGMQSADIKTSIEFIGDAADEASVELQRRIDAGGLSQTTALGLAQAVKHLANAAYLRGKLIVAGYIIHSSITDIGGGAEFLINAATIDMSGLRKDFLKDLPGNTIRLVEATIKSVNLIGKVAEVSDDAAFKLAFDDAKAPDVDLLASVAAEIANIQAQSSDADLPTIKEGAKSEGGFGGLLGGSD